jgi:hypothetical protein
MTPMKDKSKPRRLNASVSAYEKSLLLVRLNAVGVDDVVGLGKEEGMTIEGEAALDTIM